MAFVSFRKYQERAGVSSKAHNRYPSDLVMAQDLAGHDEITVVRFTLSAQLMKKARLGPGDKVEVLFDEKARLGLLRHSDGLAGNTLSPRGYSASVSYRWYRGMPSLAESQPCDSVVVGNEGIMFQIPEQASFTENLRRQDLMRRRKRGK